MAGAILAAETGWKSCRGQGDVAPRPARALETTRAKGRGRSRRRIWRRPAHQSRDRPGLDAGLPGAVEGSGLGLVPLELKWRAGRARQQPRGREIRRFSRAQTRSPDAEFVTESLMRIGAPSAFHLGGPS